MTETNTLEARGSKRIRVGESWDSVPKARDDVLEARVAAP
jgi:hypothetical protein